MKAKIRQLIAKLQRRNAQRLKRENANRQDDERPITRGTGAIYEVSTRVRATVAGGMALIHEMAQVLGLVDEIDERVRLLKVHRPYHESDHVLHIAYNQLAGGQCLENLDRLRDDEEYHKMLGARRIPGPTTAGDFCRRFETAEQIDALQDSINEARVRAWRMQPSDFFAHAMIDADGSIVPASDCTAGADFTRKGTFGFHPLVVSLANTEEVLFLDNRPGSRPSHEGAARRLDQAVELVRRAGFRRVTLRGDTDFSQTRFLDGWDKDGIEFVFGYDCYDNLVEKADALEDSAWLLLERKGYEIKTQPRTRPENLRERVAREREYRNLHLVHEHVAEFEYSPGACKRNYRMVVVKKLVTHEKGQAVLFPEIRYFFYITNKRRVRAREIVRLANTRCDQERVIGQLKSGVGALRSPLDNLFSNWAYMVMATLAWNLTKWLALLLPENGRWRAQRKAEKHAVLRMNFATFIRAFMLVPAQVIATGRRVVLRLLSTNPWQHVFFRALDAVRAVA